MEVVAIIAAAIDPVFYGSIAYMAFTALLNGRDRHIRAFFGLRLVMAFGAFCRAMLGMVKA